MTTFDLGFWDSAAGPASFGEYNTNRWFHHIGVATHPSNLHDLHDLRQLTIADNSHVTLGSATVVGLYAADTDSGHSYIDNVTRPSSAGSVKGSGAATPPPPAVTPRLLPLRDDCPDHLVRHLEAQMTGAWQPDGNVQRTSAARQRAQGAA